MFSWCLYRLVAWIEDYGSRDRSIVQQYRDVWQVPVNRPSKQTRVIQFRNLTIVRSEKRVA